MASVTIFSSNVVVSVGRGVFDMSAGNWEWEARWSPSSCIYGTKEVLPALGT